MIKLGDYMNPNLTIALLIIYFLAIYFFYKYRQIVKKIKEMKLVKAICTDVIVRRTYNRKYYMYFYKYTFKKEENTITDKYLLPIFQNKIKINNKYLMFANEKEAISPLTALTYKWYLYAAIGLIIASLLLFI